MDIEMIRGIPIEEFLSRLGHEPVRRHGDECWYLSPCREERTPSFHVNTRKGVWHDFGTGHGGDIFTLAGELSGNGSFLAQARFIAGVYGGTVPEYAEKARVKERTRTAKRKEASRFEEVVRSPLSSEALLGYLKGRGIPAGIARANCEEVRFRLYGKRYFAVGFRNVSGGYELRSRFMKWCLPPKDISVIRNGPLPATCSRASSTIFRGWCSASAAARTIWYSIRWHWPNAHSLIWTVTGRYGATLTMTTPGKGRWLYCGNATGTGLTTVPTCMPAARI